MDKTGGRMKKRDILFALGVAVVLGLLYFLSLTGKKPPAIPPDPQHMAATTNQDCQGCHGEGKSNPLRKGHPPKEQCLECHKMK